MPSQTPTIEPFAALRPLAPGDAPGCVALDHAAFPELPVDTERFAAGHVESVADPAYVAVVAERGGAIVGYAQAWPEPSLGDGVFELYGIVAPAVWRQGVGCALYEAVRAHAIAAGAATLRAQVRSDMADSLSFLAHRGYTETWRGLRMALDVASWEPAPWLGRLKRDDGVAVMALADLTVVEGWERRLWTLWDAIEDQIPRPDHSVRAPAPFAAFAADFLADEADRGCVRAGTFVAVSGDHWVALAAVRLGEAPGTIDGFITGVDAAWHHRGLGTAVKVAATAWAKSAGWQRIEVGTAVVNVGMRAINDALGFEPVPGWSVWSQPVA